jgi:hypothetical protein
VILEEQFNGKQSIGYVAQRTGDIGERVGGVVSDGELRHGIPFSLKNIYLSRLVLS